MRFTILVCLAAVLSSCAATGKRVEEGQLLQLERGKTTYYEAVAALGRPSASVRNADGTRQVIYTHAQAQLRWQNFIPILDRLYQGSDAETTTVQLNFDAQDRFVSWTATMSHTPAGYGVISGGKP
jgi:YD repeat-containing protein